MTVIVEAAWSERSRCTHPTTKLARLETSNGAVQVREVCVYCGQRTGPPLSFADHPNREHYPLIQRCDEDHAERLAAITEDWAAPTPYQEYLRSEEWKTRRRYMVRRAFNRCQLCNLDGGEDGRWLNVHHRSYERVGSEFDLDLIVLCRACHQRHHEHMDELSAEKSEQLAEALRRAAA